MLTDSRRSGTSHPYTARERRRQHQRDDRDDEQRGGHDAGAAVVEGLHAIVDGDTECSGFAWQIPADHEDDTELAERVSKGEDRPGQDPGPRKWNFDPGKALPRRESATGGSVTNILRNRLEAALDWLDDERDIRDRRCEKQPLK